MAIKAIVGLGNPGREYERTRHNAGKIFLDSLAERVKIPLNQKKSSMQWGEGEWKGEKLLLVFPLTYMNLSGKVVPWLRMKNVLLPEDLLVILDDMDIPLGTLRYREKGKSGGQKGLASIIEALGGDRLSRVRIGIGRPINGQNPSDYVLGTLHPEERIILEKSQQPFFDLVDRWLFSNGIKES
ncbi:MAG: aminoacyl-tRNA hydrolase [Nitrospirae bacterium]|jgi:PTH1 family peptidyl-tRNA hydrolase|nr:aminoacyl-tRNA hydrolase [Nitrospirota bacterium]